MNLKPSPRRPLRHLPLLLLAVGFAIAGSLPFLGVPMQRLHRFVFQITLEADQPGHVQLFYDIGNGYNEKDSVIQPTVGVGQDHVYEFSLPADEYRGLRFDPIDCPGRATFYGARIVDDTGRVFRRFDPEAFRPFNDIAHLERRNGRMEMTTVPHGGDPYLLINIGPNFWLDWTLADRWRSLVRPFWIELLSFLALGLVAGSRRGSAVGLRIYAWCQGHRAAAVAALSALVVAVQCHPVLFFGRSFASPNNPVCLLYDHFPTLPGYDSEELNHASLSDVGALMWQHVEYSLVARRAVLHDHELPLWNRDSLCGVPALGQGQFMFGDPLNALTMAAKSAAWAWDVRFVVARWLLCCGIGLTILSLTRSLPGALLGAAAGGFLSYFEFRITHPSNFTLGYAPWILFAWAGLIEADSVRRAARWALGLILANFLVMNSGTVKEAYVQILALNLAGAALCLAHPAPWKRRLVTLGLALGAGITLVLLAAPWWRTFTATLKHSWTHYDKPSADQISPSLIVGLFDDMFIRELEPHEIEFLPGSSFVVLLGLAWAVVTVGALANRRAFLALAVAALAPFAMVYGVVPPAWIIKLPFIANLISVNNFMSCPLIVLAGVMAGFGFDSLFRPGGRWASPFCGYLFLVGGLYALYLGSTQGDFKGEFFVPYAWSLAIALFLVPIGLHWARVRSDRGLAAAVLVAGFAVLTWRHCQYVRSRFEDYVFTPQVRVRLDAPSPAVAFVDSRMTEPSRPMGFSVNLFSGYSTVLGWESILGVDALRNPFYDQLAAAFGIARVGNWDSPTREDEFTRFQKSMDLLNVRYYLAGHRYRPLAIPGLRPLGQFDLDVYESASAWPRAFFTDRMSRYGDVQEFVSLVNGGDGRPFAAVQLGDPSVPDVVIRLSGQEPSRTVRNAGRYRLTSDTTSFEVEAPSAGVIVLSETHYPNDFRVWVNGRPRGYFRVNHTFKGIYVEKPGLYRVEFKYWPRSLNFSLQLAGIGLLGLAGFFWAGFSRRTISVPSTATPQPAGQGRPLPG